LHQAGIRTLIFVQFVTILPFMAYMPKMLYLVFALVVFWRWRVLRGEVRKPPKLILISALILGIAGLALSGLNQYSLDTAVAFCLLGYLLKSLEVLRRRDAIFQVYLGFFLTGVFLLYRFDPVGGLLMLILLFSNLFALQAVTSDAFFDWRYAIRQSLIMILAAIPVMIAGYLFFPRIPPLWAIPNEERGSQTGMTDEITPGSVENLARSQDPAFRVAFDDELPPRNQWYWRGNTMSFFDGNTWRAEYSANNSFGWPKAVNLPRSDVDPLQYTVIMESSGRRWLYQLDWPTQIQGEGIHILPDGRAAKTKPLNSVFRYTAQSSTSVSWDNQDRQVSLAMQLPEDSNLALAQWARDRRSQQTTDAAFVQSIAQYIRDENFFYTLKPPLYSSSNSLEAFWFGDRRGFCAHYASATAFIFRSVGIPTRLVGGYLGGTYVESGNYIQVRQMEAHVWVELWLNGKWERFDPTAAVAPGRVETNLDDLLAQLNPSDLPVFSRISQIDLINRLSIYWDSLQYQWQVLVLDYDNQQGLSWFESKFGKISALKLAVAFLLLMGLVAFAVAVSLGMIRLPRPTKEPYKTLNRIEKWYRVRLSHETVSVYFNRLLQENPNHHALSDVGDLVERMLYQQSKPIDATAIKTTLRKLDQQRH
jgi:transglutaminase-like putative cysteine protease